MPNNYDASAWFYDALAQLVFGKALVKAQQFLIKDIQPKTHILIVGGGTGWILEELARIQPCNLKITYVEISAKMLALSRKRNCGQNEVAFVHKAIEEYQLSQKYDVILTPFLFDNFSEKRIQSVFDQLHQCLKLDGWWLLCDFQVQENRHQLWQKVLLQTMYLFFGWLCNVETKTLVKMDVYFQQKNYVLVKEKTFYQGFITSKVYQKSTNF
ncbi:MAG: class I SAM-dependent methyltransferase [Mucilaginibacter sp.]|uniref:class I SAM-dependent methyltransferase n=1 Tax=Mucilaginibacter sp. TaxID=1882438 RepID=UPI0034E5C971